MSQKVLVWVSDTITINKEGCYLVVTLVLPSTAATYYSILLQQIKRGVSWVLPWCFLLLLLCPHSALYSTALQQLNWTKTHTISPTTVLCKIVHKFASVWCKTALGEVGVSFPWWCTALVLLAPGYWSLFLNLKNLFIMEKWPLVIFP